MQLGSDRPPALTKMILERERLVLREDEDLGDFRVDVVVERIVDEPKAAAKSNCRLGAVCGKEKEAFPSPPARTQATTSRIMSFLPCP